MRTRSITRQAVTIVLLAQIIFALVLSTVVVLAERHTRLRALEQQVAGRSDSLLGAIQDAEDPDDNITIDPAELRLPPDDRYAVYSDSGKLIGRSGQAGPPLSQNGKMGVSTIEINGLRYSVLRQAALRIIDRAEFGGVGLRRPVLIVYASAESHVFHQVFVAVGRFLAVMIAASLLVALITAVLLRNTLRPIGELASEAQRVTPKSLQFRTPQAALQVEELRPLAITLSTLIDELRDAFDKEQRFVGDAAHELKTAVAVVRSSLQVLLLRPRNGAEYAAGLEQTLEDNNRVEMLVTSMLELARLEQSTDKSAAPLDLAQVARAACERLHSVAEAREVRLVVHASQEARVYLGAERAHTLVTNLLTNAVRHSRSDAPINITVRRDNSHVVLLVEDTGDGIRPDALPHVFERFFRDDPSRSRTSGGTGLGLAICKSIVDSAGGTIAITSEVGAGTRVTITFSAA